MYIIYVVNVNPLNYAFVKTSLKIITVRLMDHCSYCIVIQLQDLLEDMFDTAIQVDNANSKLYINLHITCEKLPVNLSGVELLSVLTAMDVSYPIFLFIFEFICSNLTNHLLQVFHLHIDSFGFAMCIYFFLV